MGQEQGWYTLPNMSQSSVVDLQAEERQLIESIRAENPTRVDRGASPDPDLILGRIGVTYLASGRPSGYLRLFPHDFIVEEVLTDGNVVSLASRPAFETAEDQRTLWADLVKSCISGPHAMSDLQQALGLDVGKIGYAGIKDAMAVTSQRVTLRGVTKEMAEALQHERLWLRPVRYGSGALQPGDLKGNRFTIVVRSSDETAIDDIMKDISERGFINFFGPQRFGPRLISHRLGQCILQNDVEEALRLFFGEPGPFDVPLYHDVRLALRDAFGDWTKMIKIASYFPFSLRDELRVLRILERDPLKTRAALGEIKDQVNLWVYAYTSWVLNRYFSAAVEKGIELPAQTKLPLAEQGPLPEYRDMMTQDGTQNYAVSLRFYPYLQTSNKTIPTKIIPQGLVWKKFSGGWVIRFALGKGAYATSFLSHGFRLFEGLPIPEWVQLDEIDSFEIIGDGDLKFIKQRFGTVLKRRDLTVEEAEAASEG